MTRPGTGGGGRYNAGVDCGRLNYWGLVMTTRQPGPRVQVHWACGAPELL